MVFLHIDSKNYNKQNNNKKTPIDELNKYLDNNTPIFALIYMEYCGPCMETRPEWNKIKNVLKTNDDILIVDIDKDILDKMPKLKVVPSGFPTIVYINSNTHESYEDSDIQDKNRTVDSFIEWIESKSKGTAGGGIHKLDTKDIDNFNFFIKNGTMTFLTSGSNGVAFTLTLNEVNTMPATLPTRSSSRLTRWIRGIGKSKIGIAEDVVGSMNTISPFTYTDAHMYGKNVNTLLIKFVFVTDDSSILRAVMPLHRVRPDGRPNPISVVISDTQSFESEVNIQTDILLKSMNYLSPICPSPVFADILSDRTMIDNLLSEIITQNINANTKNIMQSIKRNVTKVPSVNIGILGMEFMSESITLNRALDSEEVSEEDKQNFVNMCLYLLLKLAIETGYTHSDFHIGNFMIDLNDNTYFDGLTGKPSLIDFGFTQKLSPKIFNIIKTKCNAKQYTEALKELCKIKRPDGLDMEKYNSFYGWVCGTFDVVANESVPDFNPEVNTQLIELFDLREKAIDKVVQLFNEKHEQDKSIPLLPLSNEAKKYMFAGLIGGRRGRKNNRNRKSRKTKKRSKKNTKKKRKYQTKHTIK
jgi:hypothetical protein